MKKQVLVSVDAGRPASRCSNNRHTRSRQVRRAGAAQEALPPATASPSCTSSAAATARSSATSTRARSTTSSPASRPRSSTSASTRTASCTSTRSCCPASRRPRRGRGKEGGKKITDLLKPGQEVVVQVVKDPLKTKGARLSMELTIAGRYMVYTPDGRGRRRLQAPRRQGARPPAPRGEGPRPPGRRRDRPHRRARRQARGLRARAAVPLQAPRGPAEARRGDDRARAGLPGGRPLGARRARHLHAPTSSARSSTTRSSTSGSSRSSRAPRPSSSTASSSTRSSDAAVRGLRRRGGHRRPRSRAASTCPAAAT